MLNITHTPGTVHDDGEPMTPDEARRKAAALIVAADEAERTARIHTAFRRVQKAWREMVEYGSGRDTREIEERLDH